MVGDVHHHAHVVLDQKNRRAEVLVHIEDEARHVLFLFDVHSRHRLVEKQQDRLGGERPSELDPFLQAVGKTPDPYLADVLDLEEVDDLLDLAAVFQLLASRRPPEERLQQEVRLHFQIAPGHDVVEHRHSLEERDVLEGARDALLGRLVRAHVVVRPAQKRHGAALRPVHAVDDVQHRAYSRAVRADD